MDEEHVRLMRRTASELLERVGKKGIEMWAPVSTYGFIRSKLDGDSHVMVPLGYGSGEYFVKMSPEQGATSLRRQADALERDIEERQNAVIRASSVGFDGAKMSSEADDVVGPSFFEGDPSFHDEIEASAKRARENPPLEKTRRKSIDWDSMDLMEAAERAMEEDGLDIYEVEESVINRYLQAEREKRSQTIKEKPPSRISSSQAFPGIIIEDTPVAPPTLQPPLSSSTHTKPPTTKKPLSKFAQSLRKKKT